MTISVPDPAAALKCDLASEVLRSFGTSRFSATGSSMLPAIWPGDTVVVERANPDQVRVGDIIVFARNARLCAHRVLITAGETHSPHWITQGDAVPVPDAPVQAGELLGRVSYLIRAGRLLEAPAKRSTVQRVVAQAVRRSQSTARALVFLHSRRQPSSEPTVSCPS